MARDATCTEITEVTFCGLNGGNKLAANARFDGQLEQTFTSNYTVKTRACADPSWIFEHATIANNVVSGPRLPLLNEFWGTPGTLAENGIPYCIGATDAVCTQQQVTRQETTSDGMLSTVQCSFQSPQLSAVPPGQPAPDPNTWSPQISIQGVSQLIAAERAIFLGLYTLDKDQPCEICPVVTPPTLNAVNNTCVDMEKDKCAPVQTTAGQTLPGLELERFPFQFNLRTYQPAPTSDVYCMSGSVNDAEVWIWIPERNFLGNFPEGTLKMGATSQSDTLHKYRDGTGVLLEAVVWNIDYEISYDPIGHFADLRNSGTLRCDEVSDPGCKCEINDPNICGNPIEWNGSLTTEPVNLDAAGNPLTCTQDPTYLRYSKGFGKTDFSVLGPPFYPADPS